MQPEVPQAKPEAVAPPMEPVEEPFPWWMITAGVAGVSAIALIVLIATRKKKPRETYDYDYDYDYDEDNEDDDEDY